MNTTLIHPERRNSGNSNTPDSIKQAKRSNLPAWAKRLVTVATGATGLVLASCGSLDTLTPEQRAQRSQAYGNLHEARIQRTTDNINRQADWLRSGGPGNGVAPGLPVGLPTFTPRAPYQFQKSTPFGTYQWSQY